MRTASKKHKGCPLIQIQLLINFSIFMTKVNLLLFQFQNSDSEHKFYAYKYNVKYSFDYA